MSRNHQTMISRLGLVVVLLLSSYTFLGVASAQTPSIEIGAVPESVDAGQKVTFGWKVQGSGKVSHTAVHWDVRPGNPADFKSYSRFTQEFASISPPDDAPKEYKASFAAPSSGIIYFVIHAIVDGKNIYSPGGEEKIIVKTVGNGKQPEAPAPAGGGIYGGSAQGADQTLLLVVGGVVVLGVVVAVAISRRRKA